MILRWVTSREVSARWAFLAVAVCIFCVQLPVLGFYFAGDDFVPLGDIASHSAWGYIQQLFLLRDPTPNWRFLTGLIYLALYRTFGAHAFVFLFTSLLVHIATAALIFRFVRRHAAAIWPAALASALFGMSAAHVPTVAYAMAFTHVFATFLIMLAVLTIDEALDHDHPGWWRAASVVFFGAAVASNEPVAVLAPLLAIIAVWRISQIDNAPRGEWAVAGVLTVVYATIGVAAISSLAVCNCTAAPELTGPGSHIFGNIWIYLGRLLYPIGLEWPGQTGAAHVVAGCVVLAVMGLVLVRGPAVARIVTVFLALALVPYLPVNWFLAPRYVYLAAVPFSILAALLLAELEHHARRMSPALPVLIAAAAFAAIGLSAWQTWQQNHVLAVDSGQWRTLVTGLRERYPDLPDGSRIYVRGGPLADALWQQQVMPAIGMVLWKDVQLFNAPESARQLCASPRGETYVLDFDGGALTPVREVRAPSPELVSRGAGGAALPALVVHCAQENSS